jgi:hypothetical protein
LTDEEIEAIRSGDLDVLRIAMKQILITHLREDRVDNATDEEAAFVWEATKLLNKWYEDHGRRPVRFPRELRKKAERWEERRRMQ